MERPHHTVHRSQRSKGLVTRERHRVTVPLTLTLRVRHFLQANVELAEEVVPGAPRFLDADDGKGEWLSNLAGVMFAANPMASKLAS
jgi:hypothetical protein